MPNALDKHSIEELVGFINHLPDPDELADIIRDLKDTASRYNGVEFRIHHAIDGLHNLTRAVEGVDFNSTHEMEKLAERVERRMYP